MSSSSLQRLPNGTNRFRQQYGLVISVVVPARHYTVHSRKSNVPPPSRTSSKKVEKAIEAILNTPGALSVETVDFKSRLFDPLPRRFTQQDVDQRFQSLNKVIRDREAQDKGVTPSLEDHLWEDVDDVQSPVKIPSLLFDPLPLHFKQQDINKRFQPLSEHFQEVEGTKQRVLPSFGEHSLEDVEDVGDFVSRHAKTARRARFFQKNTHRLLQRKSRFGILFSSSAPDLNATGWTAPKQLPTTLSRYRAKRQEQLLEAAQQCLNKLATSIERLQKHTEAINHDLNDLQGFTDRFKKQEPSQEPSLVVAALQTIKQLPTKLLREAGDFYKYLIKISDHAISAPRPTKRQLAGVMFAAACCGGGPHVLGPIFREV